ncbi:hypothetical protein [Nocardia yunnanensis]|uniref:hypothetical protein n=1 Tax=Nocardia yunnanensis TaxID=2382165 RepID=UPI001FEA5CD4|nr:hypothetical protein [Nocardia yunnanensis]
MQAGSTPTWQLTERAEPVSGTPPVEFRPSADPAKRSLSALMWAASVAVALIAVMTLVSVQLRNDNRSGSSMRTSATAAQSAPETTATGTPSGGPATSVPLPLTAAALENYLRQHYSLLPGNTLAAWTWLTTRYQGEIGGYDAYRNYWGTVASVTVWDVSADPDQLTVTYRLTLRYADGRTGNELRRAQLVRFGGGYLIDGTTLLS